MTQDIDKILTFAKLDLPMIDAPIKKLLADPSKQEFHQKIVLAICGAFAESCISVGGAPLRPISVESTHPYENNLDIDQTHRIPGARSLRIEFSPQCHTESNCDPLRFYQNAGRSGDIRSFSGEGANNWPSLDVVGETVHTWFHTDGSVVYWGYKFEIIPLGGSGSKVDLESYLWMLKKISKLPELSESLKNVLSPNFVLSVFMMALNSHETDLK